MRSQKATALPSKCAEGSAGRESKTAKNLSRSRDRKEVCFSRACGWGYEKLCDIEEVVCFSCWEGDLTSLRGHLFSHYSDIPHSLLALRDISSSLCLQPLLVSAHTHTARIQTDNYIQHSKKVGEGRRTRERHHREGEGDTHLSLLRGHLLQPLLKYPPLLLELGRLFQFPLSPAVQQAAVNTQGHQGEHFLPHLRMWAGVWVGGWVCTGVRVRVRVCV